MIKNGLEYAEEMKELSNSQTKKCKERLIEIKDYFKIHSEKINTFDDSISEDIKYLFNECVIVDKKDIKFYETMAYSIDYNEAKLDEIKFYDIDSIKPNETIYCGVNYINILNHKMLKIMRQRNIMLNIVRSH